MSLFSNMVKDFASLYGLIMIKIQFFSLAPLWIVYMRKVEKPAYMRKTAFVCMLENGWSFRALFRTFQPFCKNLLRRHSKITITRAKNSRQGHWSVAQRYTYRVRQTIQMQFVLFFARAGRFGQSLKCFDIQVWKLDSLTSIRFNVWGRI